jgi:integrase
MQVEQEHTAVGFEQITFGKQADCWLNQLETRKRKPVSLATLSTYRSHVRRLSPIVGTDTRLSDINNGVLRDLAAKLIGAPKTINELLTTIKAIVASAVDPQTGNKVFPRTWNPAFIDAPSIEHQKQPSLSAQEVDTAIKNSKSWQEQLLYSIAAGTGMRISELLAIRIGSVAQDQTAWLLDECIIRVRASIYRGLEQRGRLKTAAAKRDVDLAPRLNSVIQEFVVANNIQPGQFLFQSRCGGIAHLKTLTMRLSKHGILGFHSFRRFRISHCREFGLPEDLLRYAVGHAGAGITDRYSKLAENVELRKQWALRTGLGFDLDKVGDPRPKSSLKARNPKHSHLTQESKRNAESYVASDEDLPAEMFQMPVTVSEEV